MKLFKKIKNFFGGDRHEENEYYEEYDEIDDINPFVEGHDQQHTVIDEQQEKTKFRFPLIDDATEVEEQANVYENRATERKKSAVFYDVEQETGVKLPSHLPQNSLVYDVEVSKIAELLAKRNKSNGNRTIVHHGHSPIRSRLKEPVSTAEKKFLTTNPQREDVVTPVIHNEPTMVGNRKRFVPTEVPSPVHGFKRPKSIEELLPDMEKKQEEAKKQVEQKQALTNVSDNKLTEKEEQHDYIKAPESQNNTQVEQLVQLLNIPSNEEEKEQIEQIPSEETESTSIEELNEQQVQENTHNNEQSELFNSGEQQLQDLALQHLTIENSTVHIEQLLVEQPAPIMQTPVNNEVNSVTPITESLETSHINTETLLKVEEAQQLLQEKKVQTEEQQLSQQNEHVSNDQSTTSKKSGIPFNVIMLESDKKKLKKSIAPKIEGEANVIEQPEINKKTELEEVIEEDDTPCLNIESTIKIDANLQEEKAQAVQDETAVATLDKEEIVQEVEEQTTMDLGEVELKEAIPKQTLHEVEQMEETQEVKSTSENSTVEQAHNESEVAATILNADIIAQTKEELTEIKEINTLSNIEPQKPDESDISLKEKKAEPIEPTQLYEAYEKPPTDFLMPPEERTQDWAWLDEQAEYLISALASHQVQAQIESIEQGPAVTQFEITVAQGTKVSKVRNLSDDIKLALAAKDIRIDAPIPGKRTIGIEIPNRVSRAVRLSEVTDSESFIESDSPLEAALGLDLSGKPVTLDLRKMPHGLIAGATGSGKSVCINSILVSLLYKADPNELKLMLIDPKMVELAPFNKIPHLVSPVITDVKAATAALKWAVDEMERRYQLFMHAGVRDITRYNEQAEKARQFAQKLPYILIVIDELADLMMMAPADVEEAICRIAQKARACGIHLIVATQRPSVDVITGLIKSNIPTRIAFAVSSAVDSRTILDTQGAERLLGRGDMLYLGNGMSAPIRLQGTFVTDDEIEDIIAYVRNQGEPNYLFAQEDLIKRAEMVEEQDELFEEVCRYVYEQGTASTSSVQRNFHIGYNRAARLIEMLEKKGFVSEARGSKPRDVYINESDLEELFG